MEQIKAEYRARMAVHKKNTKQRVEEYEKRKLQWHQDWVDNTKDMLTHEQQYKRCLIDAKEVIHKHEKTLQVKYSQLAQVDEYGIVNLSKWLEARSYFIDDVLYPHLGGSATCRADRCELESLVDKSASKPPPNNMASVDDIERMSGIEYEQFCSKLLQQAGWVVTLTKSSGDQGVDIIADRAHTRIALQCKKYSSPVGNFAVQQICGGVKFVHANFGVVVTNAGFTPQARQLAKCTGIFLIHHSELDGLSSLVKC